MKISACLMIKNEEFFLPQCLDSIKDYVDEICILDTGSTDRTLEIAESYGAIINHQPWQNDYSFHRNESLKYPTGDWIFIIDADEKFEVKSSPEDFRKCLEVQKGNVSSIALILKDIQKGNCIMEYNRPMMYRKGQISYEDIVHNKPVIPEGTQTCLLTDATVYHYGYDLSPEKMAAKHARTRMLLEKRLSLDWDDYAAHFYIANTIGAQGDIEKLLYHAKIYIDNKDKIELFNPSIYYTIITNLFVLGRLEEGKKYLDIALFELPSCPDIMYCNAVYAVKTKDFELILFAASKFCAIYSALQARPELKGTRFIFHNRIESLAYCQYLVAVSLLGEGMKYLKRFEESIKQITDENQKKQLTEMVTKELNDIGVNWNQEE